MKEYTNTNIATVDEEEYFPVSENELITIILNGLGEFLQNDKKESSKKIICELLKALIPDTISNDKKSIKVVFILIVAQVIGSMEIEAEILQKMRNFSDDENVQIASKLNLGRYEHTADNIEYIMETAVRFAMYSGWKYEQPIFEGLDYSL